MSRHAGIARMGCAPTHQSHFEPTDYVTTDQIKNAQKAVLRCGAGRGRKFGGRVCSKRNQGSPKRKRRKNKKQKSPKETQLQNRTSRVRSRGQGGEVHFCLKGKKSPGRLSSKKIQKKREKANGGRVGISWRGRFKSRSKKRDAAWTQTSAPYRQGDSVASRGLEKRPEYYSKNVSKDSEEERGLIGGERQRKGDRLIESKKKETKDSGPRECPSLSNNGWNYLNYRGEKKKEK